LNPPTRSRPAAWLALDLTGPRRRILGMMLAGKVESANADVTSFGPRDQVFGFDHNVFGASLPNTCAGRRTRF
jgi:NADPH:quinone reductase-like Zn-dependent oxidoreductase